jgi:hypothetical protein
VCEARIRAGRAGGQRDRVLGKTILPLSADGFAIAPSPARQLTASRLDVNSSPLSDHRVDASTQKDVAEDGRCRRGARFEGVHADGLRS